ncbi:MAG TPA: hypothetical protein PK957_01770 [Candidatus Dojkabacteria bacterium]|nr:hypothetical protein [Candidatus Dojkabacteria bacterium]HQF36046.1 hypothetical protein [Candidatus Dojkabacteria bacterium]
MELIQGPECLRFVDGLLEHWTGVINQYYVEEGNRETELPAIS